MVNFQKPDKFKGVVQTIKLINFLYGTNIVIPKKVSTVP